MNLHPGPSRATILQSFPCCNTAEGIVGSGGSSCAYTWHFQSHTGGVPFVDFLRKLATDGIYNKFYILNIPGHECLDFAVPFLLPLGLLLSIAEIALPQNVEFICPRISRRCWEKETWSSFSPRNRQVRRLCWCKITIHNIKAKFILTSRSKVLPWSLCWSECSPGEGH